MDVLVFFILSIIMLIFLDKIKSKVIKISLISLNIVLFAFTVFSSNDPVISSLIVKLCGSGDGSIYHAFNGALNNRATIFVFSYSTAGALYLFFIVELIYAFVDGIVKLYQKFEREIFVLIKRTGKKNNLSIKLLDNNLFNQFDVKAIKFEGFHPLRC